MIMWYSVRIWKYLERAGYKWVMRMDDDSYLHSEVTYNIFEHMQQQRFLYGFRQIACEISTAPGFMEMVLQHVKKKQIKPTFLYDHCSPRTAAGCHTKGATAVLTKKCETRKVGLRGKGEKGWSHLGYYNNFFVTYIPFWRTQEVQGLLRHIEASKGMYVKRWNDLIIQTIAVQTFMPKKHVHWFNDFTYEHASVNNKGTLVYGGLAPGKGAGKNATAAKAFRSRYGRMKVKVFNNKVREGASKVLWYE